MTLSVPLAETLAVKWVDGTNTHDLDYLVLDDATIWEKTIEFTATATYNPISKEVNYAISGARVGQLTKWSYQGIRQVDNADTGEVFITNGDLSIGSGVLGVPQDGTWDVTYKGYIDDNVRGTATAVVTVATPFIEIMSVEEVIPTAQEVMLSSGFTRPIDPANLGRLGEPRQITLEANYNGNKFRWATEFAIIDIPVNSSFSGAAIEQVAVDSQYISHDPITGLPQETNPSVAFDDGDGHYTISQIQNTSQIDKFKKKGFTNGYSLDYYQPVATYGYAYYERVRDPDDIGYKHHWNEPEFWNLPQLWNEPYIDQNGIERKTAKVGLFYGPMNMADYPYLLYNGMTTGSISAGSETGSIIRDNYDSGSSGPTQLYKTHSLNNWDQSDPLKQGGNGNHCVTGFWERDGDDLLITPATRWAWEGMTGFNPDEIPNLGQAGIAAFGALGVPVLDGDTGAGSVYDWVKTYYNTPEPPEPPAESFYRDHDFIVSNGDVINIVNTMSTIIPEVLWDSSYGGDIGGTVQTPSRPAETFVLGTDAIQIKIGVNYPDPYNAGQFRDGSHTIEIGPGTTQGVTGLSGTQSSFNVKEDNPYSNYGDPDIVSANYQISWDLNAGTVTIQGLNNLDVEIRIFRGPAPTYPPRSPAFHEWAKLGQYMPFQSTVLDYETNAQRHHRIPGWFAATVNDRRTMASAITDADYGLSWTAYKQTPEERIANGWYSSMDQTVSRDGKNAQPATVQSGNAWNEGITNVGDIVQGSRIVRRAWPPFM